MACRITELVLDARDPELLERFWCEVLGYVELESDEAGIEIGPPGVGFGGPQPTIIFSQSDEPKGCRTRRSAVATVAEYRYRDLRRSRYDTDDCTEDHPRGVEFMKRRADDFQLMDNCLIDAKYRELPGYQRNKVRDSYQLSDRRRLLIATDRQSAFDHVLAAVPYKGQVLTQIARYWFDETADVCPNHVISYPDPNVVMVKDLDMLPIELVVRSYLTGSTNTSPWPMYDRGERVLYGHEFPDGLKKNQKLARPIITPTTKPAQGGHDAPITESEILETQLVTTEQWHKLAERSLALFARGQELAAEKGLILVDTKYEFGLDEDGMIVVADEIHTPDSSRFWIADTYQDRFDVGEEPDSLDKEFLRLWIVSQCDPYQDPIPDIPAETLIEFSNKYVALFERLTELEFEKPDRSVSVRTRIHDALAKDLPEYF